MQKEMIISAGGHETMVAILEEDLVTEIFVERERHRGVVGNIYKGRVSKVLPGMQCAFIDIGLERDGFLYVSDVVNTIEEFDRLDSRRGGDADVGGRRQRAGLPPHGSSAEPRAWAPGPDAGPGGRSRGKAATGWPQPKIEDLLKEGQEIVVQVAKEPLGTKGARLTSHATLPGRFLVFMPTVDHVGVSRKIESRDERNRLRGIVRKFREQHGFTGGVIIRTAAGGRPEADILSDLDYFNEIWNEIAAQVRGRRARPRCIYREQSLVAKLLRDLLTEEFSAIRIDNALEHRHVHRRWSRASCRTWRRG